MYQALYRKYRPQTFDDVVGQQAVTQTLKTQLQSGKKIANLFFPIAQTTQERLVSDPSSTKNKHRHHKYSSGRDLTKCIHLDSLLSFVTPVYHMQSDLPIARLTRCYSNVTMKL